MKLIIAGGREHTSPFIVAYAVKSWGLIADVTQGIVGDADGIDLLAYNFFIAKAAFSPSSILLPHPWVFRADWKRYGRSAGPRRNCEMAAACEPFIDTLIAIPGAGRGTYSMIDEAKKRDLHVWVYDFRTGSGRPG